VRKLNQFDYNLEFWFSKYIIIKKNTDDYLVFSQPTSKLKYERQFQCGSNEKVGSHRSKGDITTLESAPHTFGFLRKSLEEAVRIRGHQARGRDHSGGVWRGAAPLSPGGGDARRNSVADPSEGSNQADVRDCESVVDPRAPPGLSGGGVDARFELLAEGAPVVRPSAPHVAQQPLPALPVAGWTHRWVFPVVPRNYCIFISDCVLSEKYDCLFFDPLAIW